MKVSIYCSVYNHENYVRSALEGFVSQKTNFDYEAIILDDASTDKSADIIREYQNRYPSIIKPIIQNENLNSKGVNRFTEVFLPNSTGQYIACCEGDDFWCDNGKLQKQIDFLDTHPEYSACVHNTRMINLTTNCQEDMFKHEDYDPSVEEIISRNTNCYHTSSLVYRREYAFNRPEFYFLAKGYSDYPLAIYLRLCGKIRYFGDVMSVYRMGTNSSWTHMLHTDTIKTAKSYENFCTLLRGVDDYTNHRYSQTIEESILFYTYMQKYFEEDYSALRESPLRDIYKKQSMSYRAKTYAKQLFKPLYHTYRKWKYIK